MRNARPERGVTVGAGASFLEEDSNGWLVTFSDLVLQLFAFVLVAAVCGSSVTPGPPKSHESPPPRPRIETPAAALGIPAAPDALSLARFDDVPAPEAVPLPEEPRPVHVAVAPPVTPPAPALPPVTSLASELEAAVADAGLADAVQVAVNGGGVTLSISDTIGFASGSAALLPDAGVVLAAVRDLVAVRPDLAIEVAGHTDDVPVRGAFPSNLDLSLARASRVAHELAAGDDALAARIFAAGYGERRPLASNDDAEGRARNRRVEVRLVPPADLR